MRIIVATGLNTGTAEYKNMGDVAMLQVAVSRLLSLAPDVQVQVLTGSDTDLSRYCSGAMPLPRAGCECWAGDQILLGGYHRFLPEKVSIGFSALKRALRSMWPGLVESLIDLRLSARDRNRRKNDFKLFLEAYQKADLLVVCGSGGFADSSPDWNLSTLATIESFIEKGTPVVLFGQGMGPLADPVVLSRAKNVLPKVAMITLRGNRGGTELLESLGVASTKLATTGDDAVELAFEARVKEVGRGVGVNLRVAAYSDVTAEAVRIVRHVLQDFARRHAAPLLPVPIATHEYAGDHQTIRRLLEGFDDNSDGGLSLDMPLALIRQVGRCRVVVTGAYHAAVFSLAQGIPAVCLSNSSYYMSKFQGLEDLFGAGCTTVVLSDPDLPEKLSAAIEKAWNSAEVVRSQLLLAARRQVESSRAAYGQIPTLLGSASRQACLVPSEA